MFQIGEIVLYKTMLVCVKGYAQKDKQTMMVLQSLEENPWQLQVPQENIQENLHALPSLAQMQDGLNQLPLLKVPSCTRNALDNTLKPLVYSAEWTDWLKAVKMGFTDQTAAVQAGKKLSQKERSYFQKALMQLSALAGVVFKTESAQAEKMILDKLEEAWING